jgi:1-acyl-sn-glycerol-3-phosphate acyltransferase
MIYFITSNLSKLFFGVFYRLKSEGMDNLPATGPCILAANHNSNADPVLVGCCLKKPIHYIAKKELFKVPIMGWYLRKLNVFPVDRAIHDMAAMRGAVDLLNQGKTLLFFPEGTRRRKGVERRLKNGVAMLSATTGAPIVPVAIINTDNLLSFRRITIRYGKPMVFARGLDYSPVTRLVMEQVDALKSGCAAS